MALANCNLEDQAAYCVLGIPLVLWLVFMMPYILALKPVWMFGQVIGGRSESFLLSKAMLTYGVLCVPCFFVEREHRLNLSAPASWLTWLPSRFSTPPSLLCG